MSSKRTIRAALLGSALCLTLPLTARAYQVSPAPQTLPTGDTISPIATPGASFQPLNPQIPGYQGYVAGQAISTAVSPDGRTLLVLTSGYNLLFDASGNTIPAASNEYVFVYDISHDAPVRKQVIEVPNTYVGLAFAPDNRSFYVSGGVDDDVHVYGNSGAAWAEQGKPIPLGHYAGVSKANPLFAGGVGLKVPPQAAGLAVSEDSRTLVAANFYNDTLSIIDIASRAVSEVQLRPGLINPADDGKAGGEYPFGVAVRGNGTAYVSSIRDREIDVVRLTGTPALTARIPVAGNPNKMILNKSGSLLFVSCDNSDAVMVISTATNQVVDTIQTIAPPAMLADAGHYRGVAPNSLALSPDERSLYVTNGGTNSVAVIALGIARPQVVGLIPTGYYPNAVSISRDGKYLYAVNGKSVPGPNPGNCSTNSFSAARANACGAANQYILQLSKAGFLSAPIPTGDALAATTSIVASDNHFDQMPSQQDEAVMAALRQRIKHIVYIIKENRTYDQILGDLGEGNGDPALAEFGKTITPNAHAEALNFVDLDNFYDTGEVSGNGWPWSTSGRESDIGSKNLPVNYAGRGLSYDWEGTNRNINVGIATLAQREAEQPLYANLPDPANILPGTGNVAAPDGPQGQFQKGYIWDAALRANLTVRNYGFFEDLSRYGLPAAQGGIPNTLINPYGSNTQVAFPANPVLAPLTDPFFRGFDTSFPDFYREAEWQREFNTQVQTGTMPNLTLLRLMRDHLGSFATSIDKVNTPETQIADNDYAVAKVIQAVSQSPYAGSTLVFVVEDDAQDGPDHVDAHRSEAFIVGPYVKQHAVVSERYSTVNMVRTIEDILGTDHLSIYDAFQRPMTAVFDLSQTQWRFTATEPQPLTATTLPQAIQSMVTPLWHNAEPAAYWTAKTKGYDWAKEDEIPAVQFNMILWQGLHPNTPYPATRNGIDYDALTKN